MIGNPRQKIVENTKKKQKKEEIRKTHRDARSNAQAGVCSHSNILNLRNGIGYNIAQKESLLDLAAQLY